MFKLVSKAWRDFLSFPRRKNPKSVGCVEQAECRQEGEGEKIKHEAAEHGGDSRQEQIIRVGHFDSLTQKFSESRISVSELLKLVPNLSDDKIQLVLQFSSECH